MKNKTIKICEVEGCGSSRDVHGKTGKYKMDLCNKHMIQMDRFGKTFSRTRVDSNEFIIKDDVIEIVLYDANNTEINRALVSIQHYERIKLHKWCLDNMGYVIGTINGKKERLHRFITNAPKGTVVDHKDHNRLNCTDSNLRVCTNQENCFNGKPLSRNTSGITGVTWAKRGSKWVAQIGVDGKNIYLGRYKDKQDAIDARLAAQDRYFGEFAYNASSCSFVSPNVIEVE